MDELIIYTDGASRGNPGPAGIGVVITDAAGNTIREVSESIGETTNNVAEYQALLCGIAEAKKLSAAYVRVYADSELMVKQMNGVYQVKNEGLKPYYDEARERSREFERFSLAYIPREKNKRADALSKQGSKPESPKRTVVADETDMISETYPVRLIMASGTKADEGLTVIYETDAGAAGHAKLRFATDMAKIRFVGDGASIVTLRLTKNEQNKTPELVELILNRNSGLCKS